MAIAGLTPIEQLPSLGATTSVPGAAGKPTVTGAASGNFVGADGTVNITVVGGSDTKGTGFTNTFNDTFEKLFGIVPEDIFSSPTVETPAATDPNGAAADEVIPSPVGVPGSLDDVLKWLQENYPLLIVIGLVVLLAIYGVSSAVKS